MIEIIKDIRQKLFSFININLLLNIFIFLMCIVCCIKILIIDDTLYTAKDSIYEINNKIDAIGNNIQQFYIDSENKTGWLSDSIETKY